MTKNQGKRQKIDAPTPMIHILELAKKYFKITIINMLMKIVKKQRNRLKVNEVYQKNQNLSKNKSVGTVNRKCDI